MLVSMTPNDEVKTIHASLNDGSLRKWEFEPYTENGKIELTDQGYATIQSIKGNTVKFNQLVQNGNFVDTSNWTGSSGTFTVSNNIGRCTFTGSAWNNDILQNREIIANHKYYVRFNYRASSIRVGSLAFLLGTDVVYIDNATTFTRFSRIITATDNTTIFRISMASDQSGNSDEWFEAQNFNIFDLTLMGIDNLTTVEQVEAWLSNNIGLLPYYDYTPGTLISFKGTGLKTTGKNLLNFSSAQSATISGITWTNNGDGTYTANGTANADSVFEVKFSGIEGNYLFSGCPDGGSAQKWNVYVWNFTNRTRAKAWDKTTNVSNVCNMSQSNEVYCDRNIEYGVQLRVMNGQTVSNFMFKPMLRFGDIVDNAFEPYTSSALSLPISTYFPTGMKSAGDVYDELTESKAITRIGSRAYQSGDEDDTSVITDGTTTYYALTTPTEVDISLDLTYPIWDGGTEQILPVNSSTPTTSSMKATIEYPDRTEEVNFLYKQTTFESAIPQFSLVCKNQELPMALNDGKLICECDSSITNESGFFDAKVKMQGLNSVAYSQKIQLHVERGTND